MSAEFGTLIQIDMDGTEGDDGVVGWVTAAPDNLNHNQNPISPFSANSKQPNKTSPPSIPMLAPALALAPTAVEDERALTINVDIDRKGASETDSMTSPREGGADSSVNLITEEQMVTA